MKGCCPRRGVHGGWCRETKIFVLEFDNMTRHNCGGWGGGEEQTALGVGEEGEDKTRRQVRRCAKGPTRRVDYEGRADGDAEGVWGVVGRRTGVRTRWSGRKRFFISKGSAKKELVVRRRAQQAPRWCVSFATLSKSSGPGRVPWLAP